MASKDDISYRLHRSGRESIEIFDKAIDAACEGLSDADAKALRREAHAEVRKVKDLPKVGSKVKLNHFFNATPFEGRTGTVTHHDELDLDGEGNKPYVRVAFDGEPVYKTRKHCALRAGYLDVIEEPKPKEKPAPKATKQAKPDPKPASKGKQKPKAEPVAEGPVEAEADATTEAAPEGDPVAA